MRIQVKKTVNGGWSVARLLCIAAFVLTLPAVSVAQQVATGAYPVPTPYSYPGLMTAGPDGALWFTESNNIGRITTAGRFAEYPVPTPFAGPWGIAAGPDGALWFTEEFGNSIGRITAAGTVTAEYRVPGGGPYWITAGPDGALWFTEPNANNIGRISIAGVITEYPVPTFRGRPYGITAGPDGALWFTEFNGNNIGRITTGGDVTEYPVPSANSDPSGITAGPDGALWFTEGNYTQVGRLTVAGTFAEYQVPAGAGFAYGITTGPDGALWFAGSIDVGRITTDGVATAYPLPPGNNYPLDIATGPDGALWFTEFDANKVGEVVFASAGLSVSPSAGVYRTSVTFSGSAFAPNERVVIYERGVGSAVLTRATALADGSFTVTAPVPRSEYGPRLFLAVGQSSGLLAAASFSVIPRLVLKLSSGPVGSSVTAQGFGFGSFETVNVYWQAPPAFLGTVTANVNGSFSDGAALTFTVPSGASPGAHKVIGQGQATGALGRSSFTVE